MGKVQTECDSVPNSRERGDVAQARNNKTPTPRVWQRPNGSRNFFFGILPYQKPMMIPVWNCKGARHLDFVKTVTEMVCQLKWWLLLKLMQVTSNVPIIAISLPFDVWADTIVLGVEGVSSFCGFRMLSHWSNMYIHIIVKVHSSYSQ